MHVRAKKGPRGHLQEAQLGEGTAEALALCRQSIQESVGRLEGQEWSRGKGTDRMGPKMWEPGWMMHVCLQG